MKIIFFGMTKEEAPFVDQWIKQNGYEVTKIEEPINDNNFSLIKGHNAIVLCELHPFPSDYYSKIAELGIKQLSQRSAGFDMYDTDLATENGLIVTNVPSYSPESISEFNVMSALEMIRKSHVIQTHVKNQDFRWHQPILGKTLRQMTVGLVGVGKIGSINAQNFHGLGAKVLAYDIEPRDEMRKFVDYQETLEDLLRQIDILVLQVPLKEDTYRMIDEQALSIMKPGSYLLNMARGGVVDTKAVIEALNSGQLSHAALDTYEFEPGYVMKNWQNKAIEDSLFQEILNHPKITYTPHVAYYTEHSVQNLVEGALNAAVEVVITGTTNYRVN